MEIFCPAGLTTTWSEGSPVLRGGEVGSQISTGAPASLRTQKQSENKMDLTECTTQWGEEFFTNTDYIAHPEEETDPMSEELLSLELDTLHHLPQEAALLPENIFDDWDIFSPLNLNLEETLPNTEDPVQQADWHQETDRLWSEQTFETETHAEVLEQQLASQREIKRRGVGRPAKTGLVVVTQLPPPGKVTGKALQRARYRRMRDLNNIASQKCRLRK